jgi:hypothetical protein
VTLAGRDLRLTKQVNPAVGAVGIAQYGGGFVEVSWNDDRDGSKVTLYGLRKLASGAPDKASVIQIDTSTANKAILILHESGATIAINKDGHVVISDPTGDAFMEVDATNKQIKLSAPEVRTTSATILGASTDPTADLTIQAFVKETQFQLWASQLLTNIASAITGVGGSFTPPTAVIEYTENVKGT